MASHIWMADVKKTADGRYSGRFANAPRDLPGKKAGEVALFTEADISDWMFMRNGKIVGGETIRPLLKSLPKADADALRAAAGIPLKGRPKKLVDIRYGRAEDPHEWIRKVL